MKASTTFGLRMAVIVGVLGVPGLSLAQTPVPPVPPAPPVPATAPMPVPMPLPAPRVMAPMPMLDITLPDIAIAIPPMTLDLAELQATAQAAPRAVRDAREAADAARVIYQDRMMFTSDGDYSSGKNLIDRRQYDQAIVRFDRVIAKKGNNVEGAMYWKAYSQFKLGKTDESLATIAQLRKEYPQSRYLADAKVLEADARKRAGQPIDPAAMSDTELKLLAIGAMQNTDPERAIPLLEGVLNSNNEPVLKKRALFILAQSTQPRAYQILLNYAKGGGNPDLQLDAIRYLTANRNKQTNAQDLMQIYQSTQDNEVKLAIISALRTTGDHVALSQIVANNTAPMVVRTSALSGLTGILSPQDLWTLYEKEPSKDLRMQMVSSFAAMQAVDQLNRVVKTEKDPEVRRRALRSLGNMKSEKTGQMLTDLYAAETDVEAKKSIISGLANQNNAEGLVAIARKETSVPLKTEIVRKLADMAPRSKVAADYLMEIIK